MYHVEAVHVLQSVRSIDKLGWPITIVSAGRDVIAHELGAINPFIPFHKLDNVTVIHPFGYHGESVPF